MPRTLRARLVFGLVLLVLVVVTSTGAATYAALESNLVHRLDQQLDTTASGSLTRLFDPDLRGVQPGVRAPQQVWATALDPSGDVLVEPTSAIVNVLMLSSGERKALIARTKQTPISVTTLDGVNLRVEVRQATVTVLSTGEIQPAVVVIGLSTEDVNRTLHQLLLLELGIGGGAVMLAFLATTIGVRFSLKPLHRVTSTARDVTAELSPEGAGLDRRVPLTEADAGTEVGQLAESVNTLLGAVETQFAARLESERRMRQFLADASHELRTPLTSIRGYAELSRMRRNCGEATDEETMDRIESEGTRMSRLVEDLLTLARGDQGAATERAQVDVGELVADAVEGAHAAYPQRQIDVVAPAGLQVMGDHDQLLRVIRNLVTNACVHTAPNGPIRASAGRSGEWVVLQVADSGPGLPPEQAAHVFERFWRADSSRARSSGGSGLGLAIVESIVAAHGGTLRFDSDVREGSTVTVYLPAS